MAYIFISLYLNKKTRASYAPMPTSIDTKLPAIGDMRGVRLRRDSSQRAHHPTSSKSHI